MDVARYVVNYSIDLGKPISNLKLQKILYLLCFSNTIYRWRHGPVVVDVYDRFSKYIGGNIDEKQEEYLDYYVDDNLNVKVIMKKFDPDIIQEEDQDLIKRVVNGLIDYGAWELVAKTREEEPFLHTEPNGEITPEVIREYFNKDGHRNRIYGLF